MSEKLEIYKKKILYRASYRGTKEMDILLSSFVKKHINNLDDKLLKELEKLTEKLRDLVGRVESGTTPKNTSTNVEKNG